jgi:hypothetical protein
MGGIEMKKLSMLWVNNKHVMITAEKHENGCFTAV